MTADDQTQETTVTDTQQTLDLDGIEAAALAVPPQKRRWFQMQEQDGEILPDGTGYIGDYEPSSEVAVAEPEADERVDYFALPTVAMARFAAAADPETVLALVGEVHRLRRDLADANLVIHLDVEKPSEGRRAPQCCVPRCPWIPVRRVRFSDEAHPTLHACLHHSDEVVIRTAYSSGGSSVDRRLADGSWSGDAPTLPINETTGPVIESVRSGGAEPTSDTFSPTGDPEDDAR